MYEINELGREHGRRLAGEGGHLGGQRRQTGEGHPAGEGADADQDLDGVAVDAGVGAKRAAAVGRRSEVLQPDLGVLVGRAVLEADGRVAGHHDVPLAGVALAAGALDGAAEDALGGDEVVDGGHDGETKEIMSLGMSLDFFSPIDTRTSLPATPAPTPAARRGCSHAVMFLPTPAAATALASGPLQSPTTPAAAVV